MASAAKNRSENGRIFLHPPAPRRILRWKLSGQMKKRCPHSGFPKHAHRIAFPASAAGTNNVPTQFKSLILSHPNQTSPNKTLVQNLLILSLIFPFQKSLRPVILFVFPFPFPDFFTLNSPLYFPASFLFSNFPYFIKVFRLFIPF